MTNLKTINYYPFGLTMEGRTYTNPAFSEGYRYGFQGQEEDSESGFVNYKYRMHNPKIGRFFSVDPLTKNYPHNSPYAFSENRVIDGVELEGLEVVLIGGSVTGSAGISKVYESGYLFDFNNGLKVFTYETVANGIETNFSLGAEAVVTIFPTMPSYKYAIGEGEIFGFAAGEGLYGSSNLLYSSGYEGNSFGIGLGVGLSPVAGSYYKSYTELQPFNGAAKIDVAQEILNRTLNVLDNEMVKIGEQIKMNNAEISGASQKLVELKNSINTHIRNGDEFSSYKNLLIDMEAYSDLRKEKLKKADSLNSTYKNLMNSKTELIENFNIDDN